MAESLTFVLDEAARRHGEQTALVTERGSLSYEEYRAAANAATVLLRKEHLVPGDRVAIYGRNSAEYVVTLMAMMASGLVAVPISVRLPSSQAVLYAKGASCKAAVVDGEWETPASVRALALKRIGGAFQHAAFKSPDKQIPANSPTTVMYTSGSTGTPKGALLAYGNHYYSALGANMNIPVAPGDRWLLALPLFHVGGFSILMRAALGGGAVVVAERRNAQECLLLDSGITHISLVATQLYRLLDKPPVVAELRRKKAIVLGGGPVPRSLLRRAHEEGLPIYPSYGCTEMASQVTITQQGDPLLRLHSAGRPLPFREVRISPQGEILVRGRTLFLGYVHENDITKPFTGDGWFQTGDLGVLDEAGYLTVTGRKDNLFISGGENIQPEEIEMLILQAGGVMDAVVVPVPDQEFGERPVAFVRPRDGTQIDCKRIRGYLAERIPRFKIPLGFYPWPESCCQTGIKPNRMQLRQLALWARTEKNR